ncbi:hypothetical protein EES44_20120 [Streptomyces sp. ADI96-15]|nr:hypothetical protein EES44_20120 [Streptomyces sp. ADI96-15]
MNSVHEMLEEDRLDAMEHQQALADQRAGQEREPGAGGGEAGA